MTYKTPEFPKQSSSEEVAETPPPAVTQSHKKLSAKTTLPDSDTKRPWWRFWANSNTQTKKPMVAKKLHVKVEPIAQKKDKKKKTVMKTPAPMVPMSENSISRQQPRMDNRNTMPSLEPIPLTYALRHLKGSSDRLNMTLGQISNSLDQTADRDEKVLNTLGKIDQSMINTTAVFAKSVKSTDQTIQKVSTHIESSTKAFDDIVTRLDKSEKDNRDAFTALQKRSNLIQTLLGIALIATAIALYFVNA